MNEWMEPFISECLAEVPWGKYRQRAEKELRDHMQTQYQVLTGAGASSREAQRRVLSTMGDPEWLRGEYYVVWKQTPLCRVGWIAIGIIAIWGLIFLSMSLTVCVPFSGSLLSNGLASGIVLFLIPFSLGAFFLRICFREERRRAWWVTLGLLISWISFNPWFIRLMIAFEEYDQYYEQAVWMPMLLARFPWMKPYLWLSFMGCLALGWLFGRKTERRYELT